MQTYLVFHSAFIFPMLLSDFLPNKVFCGIVNICHYNNVAFAIDIAPPPRRLLLDWCVACATFFRKAKLVANDSSRIVAAFACV